MDGVTIAASFAGILTLVAQSIDGILKLKTFFNNFSTAQQRFGDLLEDINELHDAMKHIQQFVDLLEREPNERLEGTYTLNTAMLQAHLTSCATDIEAWVKVTEKMNPTTETGLRLFFRKFKVAADKTGFEQFRRKICSHQQHLGISLSLLGR